MQRQSYKLAYCEWFHNVRDDEKSSLPIVSTFKPKTSIVSLSQIKGKVMLVPYDRSLALTPKGRPIPQNQWFVITISREYL